MKKWLITAVSLLAVAMLLLTGCANEHVNEAANRESKESNSSSIGTKEEDQGSITLKDVNGKDVVLSSEQKIPDSFPKEVPIPDSIGVTSSISSDDSVTVTIATTTMSFAETVALYDGYLQQAGYVETFKIDEADFFNYTGKRGNEQFVVTLQLNLEDNKTVTGILIHSKTEGESSF